MDPQCGARLGVGTLIVLFTCNLVCLVNSSNFKQHCLLCSKREKKCSLCSIFFTLIRGKLALLFLVFFSTKTPPVGSLSFPFLLSFLLFLFLPPLPPSFLFFLSLLFFSAFFPPSFLLSVLPIIRGSSSPLLGTKAFNSFLPFRLQPSNPDSGIYLLEDRGLMAF